MIKKIFSILIDIIIIILIIIALITFTGFVQVNMLNKEYVNIFGYSIFKTETGSMKNVIEIGDFVILKLGAEIHEGDIVTYKENNSFITHRIIKIQGDEIITKGDNNNTLDDPIKRENVIGKVIYIINNVDVWKKVFTDIKVIIPLTITFILLIIIITYNEKTGDNNDK